MGIIYVYNGCKGCLTAPSNNTFEFSVKNPFLNVIFIQVFPHCVGGSELLWMNSSPPWLPLTFIVRAEAMIAHRTEAGTKWIWSGHGDTQALSCPGPGSWTAHLYSEEHSAASGNFFSLWSILSDITLQDSIPRWHLSTYQRTRLSF